MPPAPTPPSTPPPASTPPEATSTPPSTTPPPPIPPEPAPPPPLTTPPQAMPLMAPIPPSGWEKASVIAQWFQALAVVISLIFIAVQLRQQSKLESAANVQSMAESITPLNLKLTEPEIAALWEYGEEEINNTADPKARDIKEFQYQTLMATYLIFYENAFSQHQKGLLDDDIYLAWNEDLKDLVAQHPIEKYWDEWKDAYHENFRKHVDAMVKAKK